MALGQIVGALTAHPVRTGGLAAVGAAAVGIAIWRANDSDDSPNHSDATSGGGARRGPVADAHIGANHAAPKGPAGNDIRIVASHHLDELLHSPARSAAEQIFNSPNAYVATPIRFGAAESAPMPEGWRAHHTLLFDSYADFSTMVRKGSLPKTASAVIYDNESWSRLPKPELNHPDRYAEKFKKLAHRNGLTFITAPSPIQVGSLFEASAKHADVLVLQAQNSESRPNQYANIVRVASDRARAMNPDVKIVTEISSSPKRLGGTSKRKVATTVNNVVGADAPSADGFWPWIYISSDGGQKSGVKIVNQLARARDW